ncbi:MAG: hypothetical protein VX970_05090 [Planctomycetota bacterium]|nr:hypothetical protein [Planctomycetota bacterium]MEC8337616.1 hypothetical protein [Planctomycetota bacterium]
MPAISYWKTIAEDAPAMRIDWKACRMISPKMRDHITTFSWLPVILLLYCPGDASEQAQPEPLITASIELMAPPPEAMVRKRWMLYLKKKGFSERQTREVLTVWDPKATVIDSRERLSKMLASIGVIHPEALQWAETMRLSDGEAVDFARLEDEATPIFVKDALKLWIAQGWIQQGRHAEALSLLEGIEPENILDPASYAFARATIHHQRAEKESALELLEWLQEHSESIPERYAVLGNLMLEDLRQLKAGSLDDISRRMKQIHKQLGMGRTGDHVLKTEDEVLRMLDKLIEEESQKQANQSQAIAPSGAPTRPADASRLMGGKGPGQVTKKKIGKTAGWGDLPPKEREQAMQELSREFPAHYREVIEAYFRELAREQK